MLSTSGHMCRYRGTLLIAALCAGLATGCGAAAPTSPPAGPPDAPVPADEPRAELELTVDLAPGSDCEEALDLKLYQDRGIELIEWDEARGDCEGRRLTIRYLSRQRTAEQVLEAVRALVRRASIAAPAANPVAAPAANPDTPDPPSPPPPSAQP